MACQLITMSDRRGHRDPTSGRGPNDSDGNFQ